MNTRFVREFLARERVPLVAEDLGGKVGRQIHFSGTDFSVYLRRINSEHGRQLVDLERRYWRQNVQGRRDSEKRKESQCSG
jgi:chemotaxis protein CheD